MHVCYIQPAGVFFFFLNEVEPTTTATTTTTTTTKKVIVFVSAKEAASPKSCFGGCFGLVRDLFFVSQLSFRAKGKLRKTRHPRAPTRLSPPLGMALIPNSGPLHLGGIVGRIRSTSPGKKGGERNYFSSCSAIQPFSRAPAPSDKVFYQTDAGFPQRSNSPRYLRRGAGGGKGRQDIDNREGGKKGGIQPFVRLC